MEDLQRLMSFLNNNTSAHQSLPTPTVRSSTDKPLVPPSTVHSNAASHTSRKSIPTSSPDVHTEPDRTSTGGAYVTPNIPFNKSPTTVLYHAPPKGPYQTPSNPEPTTYPVPRPNGSSTTGSPGQTPSLSTLDPEVAQGLDQLNMYVKVSLESFFFNHWILLYLEIYFYIYIFIYLFGNRSKMCTLPNCYNLIQLIVVTTK